MLVYLTSSTQVALSVELPWDAFERYSSSDGSWPLDLGGRVLYGVSHKGSHQGWTQTSIHLSWPLDLGGRVLYGVSHKGLHQGWTQTSIHLLLTLNKSQA